MLVVLLSALEADCLLVLEADIFSGFLWDTYVNRMERESFFWDWDGTGICFLTLSGDWDGMGHEYFCWSGMEQE